MGCQSLSLFYEFRDWGDFFWLSEWGASPSSSHRKISLNITIVWHIQLKFILEMFSLFMSQSSTTHRAWSRILIAFITSSHINNVEYVGMRHLLLFAASTLDVSLFLYCVLIKMSPWEFRGLNWYRSPHCCWIPEWAQLWMWATGRPLAWLFAVQKLPKCCYCMVPLRVPGYLSKAKGLLFATLSATPLSHCENISPLF